jgi:hypothetical protein
VGGDIYNQRGNRRTAVINPIWNPWAAGRLWGPQVVDEREDDAEEMDEREDTPDAMDERGRRGVGILGMAEFEDSLDDWPAGLSYPTSGTFTRLLFYSIVNAVFRAAILGIGTYMVNGLRAAYNRH